MNRSFFAKAKGTAGEIFLYDDIGEGFFGGVSAAAFADMMKDVSTCQTLNVYINSPGGSVFDGVAIYNQLKRFKGQKTVYVDGVAASIASVIAMAGDKIVMGGSSQMMIHDPYGMVLGTADDMRKTAVTLDGVRDSLIDAYETRTKQTRDQISNWMTAETWMNPADAIKNGFADAVDENAQPVDAAFPLLAKFKNTPVGLRQQASTGSALIARMGMKVLKNAPRQVATK